MLARPKKKKPVTWTGFLTALLHVGEALHRLREALNGFVRVAVFNAIPNTVLDMALQNHLATAVQGGFGGAASKFDPGGITHVIF